MSVAIISYKSLKNSANEAKGVAKKLSDYSDSINNTVYKTLQNYSGQRTSNIQSAENALHNKCKELNGKASAFEKYEEDLNKLKEECQTVDKDVKALVSSLTADFKKDHKIKDGVFHSITYGLTSLKNKIENNTFIGRWLGNFSDKLGSIKNYIKQTIKEWWDFRGGKELVVNIVVGTLAVAVSVCTGAIAVSAIAAAIEVGAITWAAVVAVVEVVGSTIGIINGITNIINEGRGFYHKNKDVFSGGEENSDPALAKRRSEEDTIADTIMKESDSKFLHGLAKTINAVDIVCSTIGLADGAIEFYKKGYKWATGSWRALEDIEIKDLFTKDAARTMKNKIGMEASEHWKNIKQAFKTKNWNFFKNGAKSQGTDFLNNLKKNIKSEYIEYRPEFDNWENKKESFEKISEGIQLVNDLSEGNISGLTDKFVLPNVTVFGLNVVKEGRNGQMTLDFSGDKVMIDKPWSLLKDGIDLGSSVTEWFQGPVIDRKVLNKLSTVSKVNAAIKGIKVPSINIKYKYQP